MSKFQRAFACIVLMILLCSGSLFAFAQAETDSIVTNVVFDGVSYQNRTDFSWEWHKPIPEGGIKWDGKPDYMSIKYPEDEDIVEAPDGTLYIKNQLTFHAEVTNNIGEEFSTIEQLMTDYGLRIVGYLALTGTYQVETFEDVTYDELLQLSTKLSSEPYIKNGIVLINKLIRYEWNSFLPENWIPAENEATGELMGTDNSLLWLGDTLDPSSPSGHNWNVEYIHAPESWEYDSIMNNIRVVVLDSGSYEHVDYQLSEPLDLNLPPVGWHAVHVGGIIAATHNNIGVSGVFHNATLIPVSASPKGLLDQLLKTYDNFPYYLAFSTVHSIQTNNNLQDPLPTVINFSQGYYAGETSLSKVPEEKYLGYYFDTDSEGTSRWKKSTLKLLSENPDSLSQYVGYISDELKEALDRGYDFIICPSAGNANRLFDAGINSDFCLVTDTDLIDRIIVIGSFGINKNDGQSSMSYFSQDGNRVDIVAPGEWIYSTLYDNYYAHAQGTSMAAPHVSGTAAMVWSIDPKGLTGADVKRIIMESATERLPPPDNNQYRTIGDYPVLDTYAALKQALAEAKNKGTIAGTVFEQSSNPGGDLGVLIGSSSALVTLYEDGVQKAKTFTNSSGYFSFTDLTPGIYTLQASKSGWEPSSASEKIYLKSGSTETCDISLTAKVNTIRLGDYLTLGTYLGEPIVWRCVAIDENGPLMLSDKILCLKAFDAAGKNATYHNDGWGYIRESYGSNCWSDSNLRQWLNSTDETVVYSHCPPKASGIFNSYNAYDTEAGFLHFFSQSELAKIKTVTQMINVHEWESTRKGYCDGGTSELIYGPSKQTVDFSPFYYQNVTDRVFLLNPSQANAVYRNFNGYFEKAYPTEAAVKNSNYQSSSLSTSKAYPYWLGIPSNIAASYEHVIVSSENGLDYPKAYEGTYGVRPAFYLEGYTVKP